MRVWKIKGENYKALEVFEVNAEGKSVVVHGKNQAGKSSIIDAIWLALTGKEVPNEPVKEGKEKGYVEVEVIDDNGEKFFVRKNFRTGQRPTLTVTTSDKAKYSSPQKFLDEKIGDISFDPFDFIRLNPLEQKRELEKLLGINLFEIEQEKRMFLEEKKNKNEHKKRYEVQIEEFEKDIDILNKRVSAMEIIPDISKEEVENKIFKRKEALQTASNLEIQIEKDRQTFINDTGRVSEIDRKIKENEETIVLLKENIDSLTGKNSLYEKDKENIFVSLEKTKESGKEKVENLKKVTSEIALLPTEEALSSLLNNFFIIDEISLQKNSITDKINARKTMINESEKQIKEVSEKIKATEEKRNKALSSAKFNIENLEITENGVLYNGMLLDTAQISKSEIIKIGVKLAMLKNPNLKIIRIKDWNQIDHENKELLLSLLKKEDYQLFAEEVTDDSLGFVLIDSTTIVNPI